MKQSKLSIVILNYINYEETKKCVESILKQTYSDYNIVIVDNGSDNESYEVLKSCYNTYSHIYILKANQNYGFAKGNNIGIHFSRKTLGVKFVLLLNSDIVLLENTCLQNLMKQYDGQTGVMSCKVVNPQGDECIEILEYCYFPQSLYVYISQFLRMHSFFSAADMLKKKVSANERVELMSGSNILLTPVFFKKYNLLFDRTFLYLEEAILFLRCKRKGIPQKKIENVVLLHTGKQSSGELYNEKSDLRAKYVLNSRKYVVLESMKLYIKELFGRGK